MSLKKRRLIKYSLAIGLFFISLIFLKIKNQTTQPIIKQSNIKAAIIPHHLLANSFVKDLGEKVKNNKNIKQVFIIGPNHYELGKGTILTDNNQFKNKKIIEDKNTLLNDHSCWAPKSILQEYLPQAKITCILISNQAQINDLDQIASEISHLNNEEILVIASIDFSHYLTKNEADKNDLITQDLINKKDIDSILLLNNGFLDSPKTMSFLLYYLKHANILNQKIVNHSNSSDILNKYNLTSTTSYFEILFF